MLISASVRMVAPLDKLLRLNDLDLYVFSWLFRCVIERKATAIYSVTLFSLRVARSVFGLWINTSIRVCMCRFVEALGMMTHPEHRLKDWADDVRQLVKVQSKAKSKEKVKRDTRRWRIRMNATNANLFRYFTCFVVHILSICLCERRHEWFSYCENVL